MPTTSPPLQPSDIHVGMSLVEKASGNTVKIYQENATEIAWFSTNSKGGTFGECRRKDAPDLFENVQLTR